MPDEADNICARKNYFWTISRVSFTTAEYYWTLRYDGNSNKDVISKGNIAHYNRNNTIACMCTETPLFIFKTFRWNGMTRYRVKKNFEIHP